MNWWFLTLGRNFSEVHKCCQCDHTLIESTNWHKPSGIKPSENYLSCKAWGGFILSVSLCAGLGLRSSWEGERRFSVDCVEQISGNKCWGQGVFGVQSQDIHRMLQSS